MTDAAEGKKKLVAAVVNGVRYEVPDRFTLQDSRDVDKALGGFGGKIDSVIASIFLAMRDADPSVTGAQVLAIDWNDVELMYDEPNEPAQEDEPIHPPQAALPDEPQGAAI